jgi:hypothetical protein
MTDERNMKAPLHVAEAQLLTWIAVGDSALVVTDVDGGQHNFGEPGTCYYITSRREDALWRVCAGYWPDELADGSWRQRAYDPVEFLVTPAEHDRMLRDGVLDEVDGVKVGEAFASRVEELLSGRDSQ